MVVGVNPLGRGFGGFEAVVVVLEDELDVLLELVLEEVDVFRELVLRCTARDRRPAGRATRRLRCGCPGQRGSRLARRAARVTRWAARAGARGSRPQGRAGPSAATARVGERTARAADLPGYIVARRRPEKRRRRDQKTSYGKRTTALHSIRESRNTVLVNI